MKSIKIIALVFAAGVLVFSGCGKTSSQTGDNSSQTQNNAPTKGNKQTAKYAKAPKRVEPKLVKITLPVGTQFSVALSETLQTNKNVSGYQFSGTLNQPIENENRVVIPEGAEVSLVITKLVKGGTMKTPPEIAFTITEVTLPSGKNYEVEADTFYEKGRSHTGRQVGMIGGGAAAGAIVGGIIGKGKGAVIGAAAGAAAGTGAAAATGRQNLVYPAGLTFTFHLQNPLTISMTEQELASTGSKGK